MENETDSEKATPAVPFGVAIVDADKFAKDCGTRIRKLLSTDKQIGFDRFEELHGERKFHLVGAGMTQAETDRRYKAIPFHASANESFWLAALLDVNSLAGKDYLTQISIIVLQGNATEDKDILLRAEWDFRPSDKSPHHAQPHWHVYSSRIHDLLERRGMFESSPHVEDFVPPETQQSSMSEISPPTWPEQKRFHFAMLADWARLGLDAHYQTAEASSLLLWMEGCIGYILAQLQYLHPS